MKNILAGFAFAALWASASTVTKYGLQSAHSLVIANVRFFIAGVLMLLFAHLLRGYRLPQRQEWFPLALYGFLNITAYLGLFAIAIQYVSAGIGSLAIATNPLIISILSAIWLGRKAKWVEWIALSLGMIGVGIATYPLLQNSYATPEGLWILFFTMLSYSIGTIYYSGKKWTLPILTINGWQVFFGGVFLLPFTFLMADMSKDTYDTRFWGVIIWLVIGVSVGAVQLWLYLLKIDPVKAAMWLFLCPIFGFIYANLLLKEPITSYTFIGTALVLIGLYLGQKSKQ
jgi:drug/metabolite transporter (DMT)-like permease